MYVHTYTVYLCIKMCYIDVYIWLPSYTAGEEKPTRPWMALLFVSQLCLLYLCWSVCLCNSVYTHTHIYSVHMCLLGIQPDLGTQSHSSLTSLCLLDSAPPHSAHSWNATSPSECIWKTISIASNVKCCWKASGSSFEDCIARYQPES